METEVRFVIEDDDETNKQTEAKLKNKGKQKNKLISGCLTYCR